MPRAAFASPVSEHPTDSPDPRVAGQIAEYLASGGELPVHPSGAPLLLLTTRGRSTGIPRRTMLIHARSGDELLVVASRGGSDRHPAWYLNLVADSDVTTQLGTLVSARTARTLDGEERERAWQIMLGVLPAYAGMQANTLRAIPVVALAPAI
jgi:deazaflavin-dependent oxidoreductase (nitroreductase family)